MIYADDVNILGGSIHTIKENTEALIVAMSPQGRPPASGEALGGRMWARAINRHWLFGPFGPVSLILVGNSEHTCCQNRHKNT